MKNLNGSSPVHPALAGKHWHSQMFSYHISMDQKEHHHILQPLEGGRSRIASLKNTLKHSAGVSRHYRYSDERRRTSSLPDSPSQAGAPSSTRQQEWHQACARPGPLLPQDHQETGAQRLVQKTTSCSFCKYTQNLHLVQKQIVILFVLIWQAKLLRRLWRGTSRRSAIRQRRWVLLRDDC